MLGSNGRFPRSRRRWVRPAAALTLLVASLLIPAHGASAAPIFSDGFESGDMSAWTFNSGMVAQQQFVFSGLSAGRATSSGSATFAYRQLDPALADVYGRTYLHIVSRGSTAASFMSLSTATGTTLLIVGVNGNGKLITTNKVTGSTTNSGVAVTNGTWHELQVHLSVQGTSSLQEVWLDGVRISPLTRTASFGTTPIGRLYIGDTAKSRTFSIVFDDVTADVVVTDEHAPSAPSGLAASASGPNEVHLHWSASTDDISVAGYRVYRDGVQIDMAPGTATSYVDGTVAPSTSYVYAVDAFDAAEHFSALSDTASVTTPAEADTAPPTAPAGLTATVVDSRQVQLSWSPATDDAGVAGYTVFRNGTSIATLLGSGTTYRDGGLSPATTYVYAVDAFDGAGNHSPLSEPVSARTFAEVGDAGQFTVRCYYSHSRPDDPIVFPGQPGAAHGHDFFGSTSANAFSTYDSMRASSTTCQHPYDTAGYWAPQLLRSDGTPILPSLLKAYYQTPRNMNGAVVKPYPADLKVLAGGDTVAFPTRAYWSCGPNTGTSSTPQNCDGGRVQAVINFPPCWDGASLDSGDHRSHLAYASSAACPASHPVVLPRLAIAVVYPITNGSGLTLSSGPSTTLHSDFWNTWEQGALEQAVRECINTGVACGAITG